MLVPVDLSKLIDVVKYDVVKKTEYDKFKKVGKVNNIDTMIQINDTSGFVKKTDYNAKITDIECKIPDVSGLATKTALTTAEKKTPDVNSLVKKTDYNAKVTEIENKLNNHNHDKYITTTEFDTLAADAFNARLSQANLVTKTDFDNTVSSLNSKIPENKTKNESIENELQKLKNI